MKNNDGYVLIYVLVIMLILGVVAGGVLAAASNNAQGELSVIKQTQDRYEAEGALNAKVAALKDMPLSHPSFAFFEINTELIPDEGELNTSAQRINVATALLAAIPGCVLKESSIEDGKPLLVYEVTETAGTVTINATVRAQFKFVKEAVTHDGNSYDRYTVTAITCTYDSFEVVQS